MDTQILATHPADRLAYAVTASVAALRAGHPVALPTETVYGLAADALRPEAAVKIFEAKERPFFDPLIVHLPAHDWVERLTNVPPADRALVDTLIGRYWPGPLTLVLPRTNLVPDIVTSGLETVAVRMSAHPVFRAIIENFGQPLAAPSANRFGRISPTAADHVRSELAGRIPLIVDGGAAQHGVESTILHVQRGEMHVLRAGPITLEELAAFGPVKRARDVSRPDAPGRLPSHYAPRTPLQLAGSGQLTTTAAAPRKRVGYLVWQEPPGDLNNQPCEVLSAAGDLREAAATLFARLRRLDEAGLDLIVAEGVPEHGLGIAIMERLRKAAAAHV